MVQMSGKPSVIGLTVITKHKGSQNKYLFSF
jgi:hypothetical protein